MSAGKANEIALTLTGEEADDALRWDLRGIKVDAAVVLRGIRGGERRV